MRAGEVTRRRGKAHVERTAPPSLCTLSRKSYSEDKKKITHSTGVFQLQTIT